MVVPISETLLEPETKEVGETANKVFEKIEKYKFMHTLVQESVERIDSIIRASKKNTFELLVQLVLLRKLFSTDFQVYSCFINTNIEVSGLTFYDICKDIFGLNKKTVQKYLQFANLYIYPFNSVNKNETGTPEYEHKEFYDMSITQLLELNPLFVWQTSELINKGIITKFTSCEDIRNIVKKAKSFGISKTTYSIEDFFEVKKPEEEKLKPEEPEFMIDRKEEYNLFDFKSYSKSKIYMIAFNCYTSYLSLKKKIAKIEEKAKKKKEGVI